VNDAHVALVESSSVEEEEEEEQVEEREKEEECKSETVSRQKSL
jgi:hypothetical protein